MARVKITRGMIEEAVKNYTITKAFSFKLAKDLKPKQLQNAVKHIAPGEKAENIIALMDITVMGSGKKGMLFAENKLYFNDIFKVTSNTHRKAIDLTGLFEAVAYDEIYNYVELRRKCEPQEGSYYLERISCSIYRDDILNLFQEIIKNTGSVKEKTTKTTAPKPATVNATAPKKAEVPKAATVKKEEPPTTEKELTPADLNIPQSYIAVVGADKERTKNLFEALRTELTKNAYIAELTPKSWMSIKREEDGYEHFSVCYKERGETQKKCYTFWDFSDHIDECWIYLMDTVVIADTDYVMSFDTAPIPDYIEEPVVFLDGWEYDEEFKSDMVMPGIKISVALDFKHDVYPHIVAGDVSAKNRGSREYTASVFRVFDAVRTALSDKMDAVKAEPKMADIKEAFVEDVKITLPADLDGRHLLDERHAKLPFYHVAILGKKSKDMFESLQYELTRGEYISQLTPKPLAEIRTSSDGSRAFTIFHKYSREDYKQGYTFYLFSEELEKTVLPKMDAVIIMGDVEYKLNYDCSALSEKFNQPIIFVEGAEYGDSFKGIVNLFEIFIETGICGTEFRHNVNPYFVPGICSYTLRDTVSHAASMLRVLDAVRKATADDKTLQNLGLK